jgi:hypothetical protein
MRRLKVVSTLSTRMLKELRLLLSKAHKLRPLINLV